ncbi:MAG: DUF465 domain-containing protein [Rhodobacteraceae bacterium]|nr:DUF465 domain-containing protein [Paracoccaceae bacterium]
MSEIPHELHGSFPELAGKMDELIASDRSFAKLVEAYDEVNQKAYSAGTLEKPTSHFREEDLKKRRLVLRDEIYRILSAE